jgi:three-Cys-motif partner protein
MTKPNIRNCVEDCRPAEGNCYVLGQDDLPVQCVGPWVNDKYYFLERYLVSTQLARKKFSEKNNAVYIDLFSGPGKCIIRKECNEIDNGCLRVIKNQTIPFNEYYFIDILDKNIVALEKRLGKRESFHFIKCDSNIYISELIKYLLQKPYRYHFTYIDPFGPNALSFETISQLSRLSRIDLLIHFPIGPIRRNIFHWQESDFGILDRFLGTTDWRTQKEKLIKGQMLHVLLEIYKNQLQAVGFPEEGLRIVESDGKVFETMSVVSIKNTKDVELYVLILASKHHIAQKIWNSVIKIGPQGQRSFL